MAINTGDVYRCTIEWVMANQICANTLHFRSAVTRPTGDADTHMDVILTRCQQVINAYASHIWPDTVRSERITTTKVFGTGDPHARDREFNAAGLRAGELLPGFSAVPLYLGTDYSGRSLTGRFHAGGWLEADQDAGTLTAGGVTALTGFAGEFTTALGISNNPGILGLWFAVVFSRKLTSEGAALANAAIKSVSHRSIMGTVYTRKIGRGQ